MTLSSFLSPFHIRVLQLRRVRSRVIPRRIAIHQPLDTKADKWRTTDGELPLRGLKIDEGDEPSILTRADELLRGSERYKIKNAFKRKQKMLLQLNFDHIPIEDQVVLMFPGEGMQHLKMGEKVLDNPSSTRLFEEANEFLKFDLLELCLNGPKTKLDQTFYSQLAIFVSSMAAFEKLKVEQPDLRDRLTHCTGYGTGEISALVAADVITFSDALKLATIRAKAMDECSKIASSGMITIRTNARSNLVAALKEAREYSREKREAPICDIASYLFCHVKVVAGTEKALEYFMQNSRHFNIQVLKKLPLYGAFHTQMMDKASRQVEAFLGSIQLQLPRANVYSNYTGKCYTKRLNQTKTAIARQISSAIKWEQIMQIVFNKRRDDKFPSFIEVGPGRELGLILYNIGKKASRTYMNYPA